MEPLYQIFIGSVALSIVHASIPNHWLPLIALGKAEKWTGKETLTVTAITGFAHTLSTVLIGIVVGLIGHKLSESYRLITTIAAPIILIALGSIYLFIDIRQNNHHNRHIDIDNAIKKKTKTAIIISLAIGMFFSPCIEIEAYYFVASSLGWLGILTVSSVYLFVTLGGMLLLVYLASRGIEKLKWHFLEHHEKLVTGILLIVLGIVAFFME